MKCADCPFNSNGNVCGRSKFYEGAVGVSCKFYMDYLERQRKEQDDDKGN